jgi:transcription elongation GreA/GreB family factor
MADKPQPRFRQGQKVLYRDPDTGRVAPVRILFVNPPSSRGKVFYDAEWLEGDRAETVAEEDLFPLQRPGVQTTMATAKQLDKMSKEELKARRDELRAEQVQIQQELEQIDERLRVALLAEVQELYGDDVEIIVRPKRKAPRSPARAGEGEGSGPG